MSGAAGELAARRAAVAAARRRVAVAQAELAAVSVAYADARIAGDRRDGCGDRVRPGRARAGEFVADELSLVVREQPFHVFRSLARSRRVAAGLPTVWAAFVAGQR